MTTIGAGVENNFNNSYILEKLIPVDYGWKVAYKINKNYFVEYVIAYALIRNGSYYESIPLTHQELYLTQPLSEYVLKDGYIGSITPKGVWSFNEHTVIDIKHTNVRAIEETLKKNRVKLDLNLPANCGYKAVYKINENSTKFG